MINKETSKKILTIGCAWKKPKGGIAVVLNSYSRIFQTFNNIVNSDGINFITNLSRLIYSIIITFFKLLFCKQIKIVHIHTSSYNSFRRSDIFVRIAKMFNRKVVIHIHSGAFKVYYAKNKEYVHKVLDKCDTIVALTETWKDFFVNELKYNNTIIVPNIVEEPTIINKDKKDNLIHILYLGLITQQKGIYDLVETINEHKEELTNKIVLHIGGNGETETIQQMIAKYSLENIIKFEGWISGNKKIEMLNSADIFILPSYAEGLPISILEAMSYRLPVISTPVGGIPEIIKDGINGILVTPGNKDTLFDAIIKLSNNKTLRENMGEFSFKNVQGNFPNSVSKKLETIYTELL